MDPVTSKPKMEIPHSAVLTAGRDPLLLDTRSQVLRAAGYTVVAALGAKAALAQFQDGDFDLVVLCHSISQEEREDLEQAIRARSPRTPIVLVSANSGQHDRLADATLENDPGKLLSGIRDVMDGSKARRAHRDGPNPA